MNNPMPVLHVEHPDYHQSLGIFGKLITYSKYHHLSLGLSYDLVTEAIKNKRLYFFLNNKRQPLGALIWADLSNEMLNKVKKTGWNFDNELLSLLSNDIQLHPSSANRANCDQLLILQLISPFGEHKALIDSWRQHYQYTERTCWALSECRSNFLRHIF